MYADILLVKFFRTEICTATDYLRCNRNSNFRRCNCFNVITNWRMDCLSPLFRNTAFRQRMLGKRRFSLATNTTHIRRFIVIQLLQHLNIKGMTMSSNYCIIATRDSDICGYIRKVIMINRFC